MSPRPWPLLPFALLAPLALPACDPTGVLPDDDDATAPADDDDLVLPDDDDAASDDDDVGRPAPRQSGCGCASGGAGSVGWIALLVPALWRRRRRGLDPSPPAA